MRACGTATQRSACARHTHPTPTNARVAACTRARARAQVIDVSAGRRLAQLAPAAVEPLLAEGFDHQNLEACPLFLPRLREFLGQLSAKAAAAAAAAGHGAQGAAAKGGKGAARRR